MAHYPAGRGKIHDNYCHVCQARACSTTHLLQLRVPRVWWEAKQVGQATGKAIVGAGRQATLGGRQRCLNKACSLFNRPPAGYHYGEGCIYAHRCTLCQSEEQGRWNWILKETKVGSLSYYLRTGGMLLSIEQWFRAYDSCNQIINKKEFKWGCVMMAVTVLRAHLGKQWQECTKDFPTLFCVYKMWLRGK